jgi:hypothetical protein
MGATTIGRPSRFRERRMAARAERAERVTPVRTHRLSLGTVALIMLIVSAWGGIIPYVGPLFGYDGNGVGSWYWSLTHSVVALIPACLGVLVAVWVLASLPAIGYGAGRARLSLCGLLAMIAGAWFVVGPLAWRVVDHVGPYFAKAGPLHELAFQIGYSFGPGVIVAAAGGFFLGWASGAQPMVDTAATPAAVPVAGEEVGIGSARSEPSAAPVEREPATATGEPMGSMAGEPMTAAGERTGSTAGETWTGSADEPMNTSAGEPTSRPEETRSAPASDREGPYAPP